jgi:hypothetical protein
MGYLAFDPTIVYGFYEVGDRIICNDNLYDYPGVETYVSYVNKGYGLNNIIGIYCTLNNANGTVTYSEESRKQLEIFAEKYKKFHNLDKLDFMFLTCISGDYECKQEYYSLNDSDSDAGSDSGTDDTDSSTDEDDDYKLAGEYYEKLHMNDLDQKNE